MDYGQEHAKKTPGLFLFFFAHGHCGSPVHWDGGGDAKRLHELHPGRDMSGDLFHVSAILFQLKECDMSGGDDDNEPTIAEEIKGIADELRDTPPTTPEQAKEIADHLKEIAYQIRNEDTEGNDTGGGNPSTGDTGSDNH